MSDRPDRHNTQNFVPPSDSHNSDARKGPRFKLTPFKDVKPDASAPYLVKNLLPRRGLVVVWGPPKCGKSFWTSDLLMHIALGWDYRGLKVRQGVVVYCALEGAPGFTRRIEAFRQAKLADSDDIAPPFYLMTTPLGLIREAPALIADIKRQLGKASPAVICIDTLNRSLVGSESSDEDMTAYIRAADALAFAFDCQVVMVHHSPHDATRPRGHSSLMGALDAQISVRRDRADNVIAELELSKDGDVGLSFASRLLVIAIGTDEDGDPVTSCVVDPVEGYAATRKAKTTTRLSPAAKITLRALNESIDDLGAVPPASNHIPPKTRTVSIDKWRERAFALGVSTGEDRAKRAAFQRGVETLVAHGHAAIWREQAWPV
jgi:hypothetical protein